MKELQVLWRDVRLDSSFLNGSSIFQAALLCVSCDIPATRKCCGFKSYAARLGCHNVLKKLRETLVKRETTLVFVDKIGNLGQNRCITCIHKLKS